MKSVSTFVVIALCACGKSDDKPAAPMEPPVLSAAGDVKVPPGHETTFDFDGKPLRLEYTWIEILSFETKPAFRLFAQGGPRRGMFSVAAAIPPGTASLEQLAGTTVGAFASGVSFGNTPDMATGTGATIKIDEVTATYVSGTFEADACAFAERQCASPKKVTNGKFKAFRSALADDAAFKLYTKQ